MMDECDVKYPDSRLISGGAYSGKSQFVAIDCCRYLMYENYTCLLLRNTLREIKAEGEVISKLERWLCDPERLGDYSCKHNHTQMYFEAHSGARIYYGSCDSKLSMDKLRGSSYHRIYTIESSELDEEVLDFLPRSLRSPHGYDNIPLQITHVSNPSFGAGVDWLKRNYINEDSPHKHYRLNLMMNKFVPREQYDKQLSQMSPLQQAFMRYGDWNFVADEGLLISREEFMNAEISDYSYDDVVYSIVAVDLAGEGDDNTSMSHIMVMKNGEIIIDDNKLVSHHLIEEPLKTFVSRQLDKHSLYNVVFEQEGGSSSTYALAHFESVLRPLRTQHPLPFNVTLRGTGGKSKFDRAVPFASMIREKRVRINKDLPNKNTLINQLMYLTPIKLELKRYPSPDIVDSLSIGFNFLSSQVNIEAYSQKLGVVNKK
ncbi:MAG: phage terminase large subunit [Prevotella sp.]|nr:phage terminase large subunit [Prevotella sp.]